MSQVSTKSLGYIEFTSPELDKTQGFFADVFGWSFVNFGDDYRDIQGAGIGGGIARGELVAPVAILQTDDLQGMLEQVKAAGGQITKEIFAFPGGHRFHFKEPGGNELAIFSQS